MLNGDPERQWKFGCDPAPVSLRTLDENGEFEEETVEACCISTLYKSACASSGSESVCKPRFGQALSCGDGKIHSRKYSFLL